MSKCNADCQSFLSSPAPKSKRETARNDFYVIQIHCELSQISPLKGVLLSSLKLCATWLSEVVCLGHISAGLL